MTNEEKVKGNWPGARVARMEHATPYTAYVIVNGDNWLTGFLRTPEAAWEDAAKRIEVNSGERP